MKGVIVIIIKIYIITDNTLSVLTLSVGLRKSAFFDNKITIANDWLHFPMTADSCCLYSLSQNKIRVAPY